MLLTKLKNIITSLSNSSQLEYRKLSYSQSGEDLIIKYIFDNIGIARPSYLDIGAHHPYFLSNTALFYSMGCRGINIEPDPSLFLRFKENRKEDFNLNIGIGSYEGSLDFYLMSASTLNTFCREQSEHYSKEGNYYVKEVKKISVKTIQSVLDQYAAGIFPDFLTLDAEGIDEIVLKSIDFEKNKPTVICTETISFSETGRGIKNKAIIDFVVGKGYLLYADTNNNSIFVDRERWERDS